MMVRSFLVRRIIWLEEHTFQRQRSLLIFKYFNFENEFKVKKFQVIYKFIIIFQKKKEQIKAQFNKKKYFLYKN